MKAGPKRAVTAEPLDLSGLPTCGSARVVAFVEGFLRVPKGTGALEPVRLRSWQRDIVRGLYDEPRPRQALVSIPRGNGKTSLGAMLALYGLLADVDGEGRPVEGAQVLCVATDERQARQAFSAARRMVELDERLAEQVQVFADRLYVPRTDSTLAPLPADPASLQGWDPTLVVLDELHVVTSDTYEAVVLASGKRDRSLVLAISTPAGDRDGPMWRLVERGRQHPDDGSLYLREYAAADGCATDDESAWHEANPALGDFLQLDALRATLATTRESSWRRYRLGQWAGSDGQWLDDSLWAARADATRVVADGEPVVLGFDGSASGDSTALVGCTLARPHHVFVLGLWENPGDPRWRVPRAEVAETVAQAFGRYDVRELACDPWGWREAVEQWSALWPAKVIEWPTNVASRMAPATDRAYAAVRDAGLTHDGDARLASHVGHCVARSTPMGDLVAKDRKSSPRKIDAAVAMIVALDRAAFHATRPAKRRRMLVR